MSQSDFDKPVGQAGDVAQSIQYPRHTKSVQQLMELKAPFPEVLGKSLKNLRSVSFLNRMMIQEVVESQDSTATEMGRELPQILSRKFFVFRIHLWARHK